MSVREDAFRDWKAGMKPKEIADKYGVSGNTVKSWLTRSKKEQGAVEGAPSKQKRVHPPDDEVHPVKPKRGAPQGNQNAVGNSGGAPIGNTNNLRHGFYWDCLTEDEQALLTEQGELTEEERLLNELALWMVRERRLTTYINEQKAVASGLAVEKVTREGKKTITTAGSTFDRIAKLDALLTSAQRSHQRCITALNDLRVNRKLSDLPEGNEQEDSVVFYIPDNGRDRNDG